MRLADLFKVTNLIRDKAVFNQGLPVLFKKLFHLVRTNEINIYFRIEKNTFLFKYFKSLVLSFYVKQKPKLTVINKQVI